VERTVYSFRRIVLIISFILLLLIQSTEEIPASITQNGNRKCVAGRRTLYSHQEKIGGNKILYNYARVFAVGQYHTLYGNELDSKHAKRNV
jgi:hypothetical protein